ncbi:putative GPI-anchored protein pfl2 [Haliotis rubra]|uniref:putative GPI-anchored protein pfl2 n=1 Tax=Haliotis rubra TaxID=36100 RepID=UPI001EE599D1|nr:putative GPI-anchored protein pfl2 [Haliotis rubra]XP_046565045.1 putative GPI-anchored protein pfl2 [Haliotis rubra]
MLPQTYLLGLTEFLTVVFSYHGLLMAVTTAGRKYTLFRNLHSWNEVRDICITSNMGMLKIASEAEMNGFKKVLEPWISDGKLTADMWLGLYDKDPTGADFVHYWQYDCTPLGKYAPWLTNIEPDGKGSENCVRTTKGGVFKTRSCVSTLAVICQNNTAQCWYEEYVNQKISNDNLQKSSAADLQECKAMCLETTTGTDECVAISHDGAVCNIYTAGSIYIITLPSMTADKSYNTLVKRCYDGNYKEDTPSVSENKNRIAENDCTTTTSSSTTTASTTPTSVFASTTTTPAETTTAEMTTTTVSTSTSASEATSSTPPTTTLTPTTASTTAAPTPTSSMSSSSTPPTTTLTPTTTSTTAATTPTSSMSSSSKPPTTTLTPTTASTTAATTPTTVSAPDTTTPTAATSTTAAHVTTPAATTSVPITSTVTATASTTVSFTVTTTSATISTSASMTSSSPATTTVTKVTSESPLESSLCNNSGSTSGPDNTTCSAICVTIAGPNSLEWQELMRALILNRKMLSSYRRAKTSARDDRPSAGTLGASGIGILVLVFGSLILLDMDRFVSMLHRWYKMPRGNKFRTFSLDKNL